MITSGTLVGQPFMRTLPVILSILTCQPLMAIDIEGHTAIANDRFANDPAFIGSSFDWTGVGRATTGTAGKGGHWVTMISPNVFLSANHYHPAIGTDLHFYPDNDSASSTVVRTITSGQRVGSSDLWIGSIDQILPDTIHYYDWHSESLNPTSFATSILAMENALTTGITPTNIGYGSNRLTSMAVGRNVIDNFVPSLDVNGTIGPALRTLEDTAGDSNVVVHESQLVSGDSGAPLFINVGGELRLVGINWATGQVDIDANPRREELRNASFYAYVGNDATTIQSYVDANLPTTIPEPSTSLALLLGMLSLAMHRQRP